jgi:hypothetical protein
MYRIARCRIMAASTCYGICGTGIGYPRLPTNWLGVAVTAPIADQRYFLHVLVGWAPDYTLRFSRSTCGKGFNH